MTTVNKSPDAFWADDPSVLFRKERLTEFFPSNDKSRIENLNAITRLGIYVSVLLVLYHSHAKYAFIGILVATFTYFLFSTDPELRSVQPTKPPTISPLDSLHGIEGLETLENSQCTQPTLDNPFMNATMKDYLNVDPNTRQIVDRPPACNPNDPAIKKDLDKYFNNNLFKDVSDVFGKMNSQRQFFTMPWTTIPNDPNGDFAKWLYASPATCKENADYCLRYEDVRAKRPVLMDPTVNPPKNA